MVYLYGDIYIYTYIQGRPVRALCDA